MWTLHAGMDRHASSVNQAQSRICSAMKGNLPRTGYGTFEDDNPRRPKLVTNVCKTMSPDQACGRSLPAPAGRPRGHRTERTPSGRRQAGDV